MYLRLIDTFKKLKSSEFVSNSFTLIGGVIVAQGLPFFFYPIFSRIYSPDDFGLLATITSIIPILTILSSGMFEGAILVSKSKEESANLVGLILVRSIFFLLIFTLIFKIYSNKISIYFREPELGKWLLLIPLMVFSTVLYNVFNEWCVAYKYFKELAVNKVINTSLISGSKFFFGIIKLTNSGLVFGELIGRFFSAVVCLFRALKYDSYFFFRISSRQFLPILKKYKNFPRFLLPDQILNYVGGAIHVFFIGAYFGNNELGYVSMGMSLLTVPVTVISASIKDVFRQKANLEFKINGTCRSLYINLLIPLLIFGFIFFGILYFIIPTCFDLFLGPQWQKTVVYSQILIPMFFVNFVSMSLGGVLIITGKMIVSIYWQLFTIILSSIAFLIGVYFFQSITETLILFSIARTISYIVYAMISYFYTESRYSK